MLCPYGTVLHRTAVRVSARTLRVYPSMRVPTMRVPVFSVGMRFSVNLLTGKPKMADIGPTCCSGICGVCVCGGGRAYVTDQLRS